MASELDVVNHLLSLERQASPGPWGSGEGCVNGYIDYQARDDERGGVEPLSDYDGREPVAIGVGAEDRAFIVAMRNECVRLLTNYAAILNACAAAQVDPARVGEVLVGMLSLLEVVANGATLLDMRANYCKPSEYAATLLSRLAPAPAPQAEGGGAADAFQSRSATDFPYDEPHGCRPTMNAGAGPEWVCPECGQRWSNTSLGWQRNSLPAPQAAPDAAEGGGA